MKQGQDSEKRLIIDISESSKEKWLQQISLKRDMEEYLFLLTIKAENEHVEIPNLIYFFCRLERLITIVDVKSVFSLKIKTDGQEMIYKLKTFLICQLNEMTNLKVFVCVDGKKEIEISRSKRHIYFGSILPLLKFINKDNRNQSGIYYNLLNNASEAINENEMDGSGFYNETNAAEMTHLFALKKIFFDNYKRIIDTFTGTERNKLGKQQKEGLRNQLIDFSKEHISKTDLLSQVMWSIIVASTIKFTGDKKEEFSNQYLIDYETNNINYTFLNLSLSTALSISSGIYQLIENSCLHSSNKFAYLVLRNHRIDAKKSNEKEHLQKRYTFNADNHKYEINDEIPIYFEIIIADSPNENFGISDHYNSTKTQQKEHTINKRTVLREMFDKRGENIIEMSMHYGMSIFKDAIMANNGCFIVESPYRTVDPITQKDTMESVAFYSNKGKVGETYKNFDLSNNTVSEYRILFPLNTKFSDYTEKKDLYANSFDCKELAKNYNNIHIVIETDWLVKYENVEGKEASINRIVGNLRDKLTFDEMQIINFYLDNISRLEVEIVIKAILRFFGQQKEKICNNKINFVSNNEYVIIEIIRVFTVFFRRIGEVPIFQNTQFALTCENKLITSFRGSNIKEAAINAILFAYNNSSKSVQLIPVINYLCRQVESATESNNKQSEVKKETNNFPFALHVKLKDKDKCLFLDNVYDELTTDYQFKKGYFIPDVHIRIGSKIHIKKFYEAEAMFCDPIKVNYFAMIVAKNIISKLADIEVNKIILVGYEEYSEMLICRCIEVLRKLNFNNIGSAIFLNNNTENESFRFENVNKVENNTHYFFVVPIGSTLSTFYKIKNKLIEQVNLEISPYNICLLVVCDKEDEFTDIEKKFWMTKNSDSIELLSENGSASTMVDVLLKLTGEWHEFVECDQDENHLDEKALIHVDNTSTIPSIIFSLWKSKNNYIAKKSYADLKMIKQSLVYQHIVRDENHYQYYIDFKKFNEIIYNDTKIDDWLNDCANSEMIDPLAYNIVIAPQNDSNARFVNDIIEKVFFNRVKVVNVKINSTYKDEIKSKFSEIAEEYQKIYQFDRDRKIHVYYIDECISTGATINRAKIYARMLFGETKINEKNITLFRGVFVLINRSSSETIENIIDNKENFCFFMQINIPQYNTHSNKCPSCFIADRFTEFAKKTATNALSIEWIRLEKKHDKKDFSNYRQSMTGHILQSPSYFYWLTFWLYNQKLDDFSRIDDSIKENCIKLYNLFNITLAAEKNERFSLISYLKTINDEMVGEFSGTEGLKSLCLKLILDNVINERDFYRFICADAGYRFNEDLFSKNNLTKEFKLRSEIELYSLERMIELIAEECGFSESDTIVDLTRKCEMFVSYVKTFSRPLLSRYHHIRQAIFTLMLNLVHFIGVMLVNDNGVVDRPNEVIIELSAGMTIDARTAENFRKILRTIVFFNYNRNHIELPPLHQYQTLLVLIKKLADLESQYVFKKKNLTQILNVISKIKNRYDGKSEEYKKFNDFPGEDSIISELVKIVYSAIIVSEEKNLCISLEKQALDSFSNIHEEKTDSIYKWIYLENNQIIREAMHNIKSRISGSS